MDDWKSNSRMTLQKKIVLSKNHIDILTRHARECVPNESCAILFGKIENENFVIKDAFLTKNIKNSSVEFSISPEDLIVAYKEAEKRELELGIFHSHPDSDAYPSPMDEKYMELNQPHPWIIFSIAENQFKAYIFESGIIPIVVTIL